MSVKRGTELWKAIVGAVGSLLPSRAAPAVSSERVILPWRDDAQRTYPSIGLTPSRALALVQSADHGSPAQLFELFSEMLVKWPRLAAVEQTRRLALTGLEWEIAAAARHAVEDAEIVEYCEREIDRLDTLSDVLAHLSGAIGIGTAVAEIVWENGRVVDLTPAPFSRLTADSREPWRLRIRTEDAPNEGVPLDEQPNKWLVFAPSARMGRPFEGGLLRASLLLFLAQNLSFKDWLVFSQVAGMPVRVAQFDPGVSEADRQQVLRMLQSLGTEAVAAFTKNIELKFMEAARGGERPYQALQQYCNTEITILWLGQHLTTDIGSSGSRAAAEVHDRVREDLLVHDIANESRLVRQQLLTPLVRARFGDTARVPHFRRSLIQSVDSRVLADTLSVAVNELGVRVPLRWAHRALGIPEPRLREALVNGQQFSGEAREK
ncbi:MAG: DUF935 family protein [Phycisphaerales bacterium]|nr:DUF935 family protein [Phycisphaerales bacterium]